MAGLRSTQQPYSHPHRPGGLQGLRLEGHLPCLPPALLGRGLAVLHLGGPAQSLLGVGLSLWQCRMRWTAKVLSTGFLHRYAPLRVLRVWRLVTGWIAAVPSLRAVGKCRRRGVGPWCLSAGVLQAEGSGWDLSSGCVGALACFLKKSLSGGEPLRPAPLHSLRKALVPMTRFWLSR